jgi:hypothetical protein
VAHRPYWFDGKLHLFCPAGLFAPVGGH